MGVLGGAHCVTMCGGVVGVLCAGLPSCARARPTSQLGFVLAYNAGRVSSYAFLGALAGGLGALVERAGAVQGAQIGLRVVAALLMLGVGLFLVGVLPRFAGVERIGAPLWRSVEPLARRLLPIAHARAAFLLGALWGLLPCGLVYAALGLAIASGSLLDGGATMLAFGAGTLPVLIAMGAFAATIARFSRRAWLRKTAGAAIAIFGAVNLVTASAQAAKTPIFGAVHACCATMKSEK
jgi:sulfite exporter TauE/SafE